mmetsp:Transcript_816/g.2379  ORF Transcript_816/g.2379 Transcript_816/m.2379 type:complete len:310 (-) Transcript_816:507-1436(-)
MSAAPAPPAAAAAAGRPAKRLKVDSSPDLSEVSFAATAAIADVLKETTKHRPTVLIICGSGLGHLADDITEADTIHYKDIPNFAVSTVSGHKGQLVFGLYAGKCVVAMQGRVHMYEGHPLWKATLPVRVLKHMGVTHMVVTNAAGGINSSFKIGDLMIMSDHINLPGMSGNHPLRGPNDGDFGTRFPPMNQAYSSELRALARAGAKELGLADDVKEGVYAMVCGPSFETAAEIKMLQVCGADVVGMSTCPEVTVAVHCGIKCFGMSLVTNVCITDVESKDAPSHEEVKDVAGMRAPDAKKLVSYVVERM